MNASINYATPLDHSPCGSQEPLQAGRNLLVSSFLREMGVWEKHYWAEKKWKFSLKYLNIYI